MKTFKELQPGDTIFAIIGKNRSDVPVFHIGKVTDNHKINVGSLCISYDIPERDPLYYGQRNAFVKDKESVWYHELRDDCFYTDQEAAKLEYKKALDSRIETLKKSQRILIKLEELRKEVE